MVYFEKGRRYGSKTVIVVQKTDKDSLTYRYASGKKHYTVPIHWARLKNIDHPVQYVRIKGKIIWAVERK